MKSCLTPNGRPAISGQGHKSVHIMTSNPKPCEARMPQRSDQAGWALAGAAVFRVLRALWEIVRGSRTGMILTM
jgi:hypothetical protein